MVNFMHFPDVYDMGIDPGASSGIDLDSDLITELAQECPNLAGVKLTYVGFAHVSILTFRTNSYHLPAAGMSESSRGSVLPFQIRISLHFTPARIPRLPSLSLGAL